MFLSGAKVAASSSKEAVEGGKAKSERLRLADEREPRGGRHVDGVPKEGGEAVNRYDGSAMACDAEKLGPTARNRDDSTRRDEASDLAHAQSIRIAGDSHRQDVLQTVALDDGRDGERLVERLAQVAQRLFQ
jgi:hypothetical protein